jgi:hypothetical protein
MPDWDGIGTGWVIDGFPQTAEQATYLQSIAVTPTDILILKEGLYHLFAL